MNPEVDAQVTLPELGILVGVTLLGLCIAGILAGYLMQREMMNARIEQTKARKKPMEKAKGEKKPALEVAPAKPKKQKVA